MLSWPRDECARCFGTGIGDPCGGSVRCALLRAKQPVVEQVLFCDLTAEQRGVYRAYLDSKDVEEIFRGKRQALQGIDVLRKAILPCYPVCPFCLLRIRGSWQAFSLARCLASHEGE